MRAHSNNIQSKQHHQQQQDVAPPPASSSTTMSKQQQHQQQQQHNQQAAAALAASSSRSKTYGGSGSFSCSSGKQLLDLGSVFFSFFSSLLLPFVPLLCRLRLHSSFFFSSAPSFSLHILPSCSSSPSSSLASCVAMHTQDRQKNSNTSLNETEKTKNEIEQL